MSLNIHVVVAIKNFFLKMKSSYMIKLTSRKRRLILIQVKSLSVILLVQLTLSAFNLGLSANRRKDLFLVRIQIVEI
jgi:hypothetical protein